MSTHRNTPDRMEKTVYVRPTFTKLPSDKKERILDVAIDEFSRCGYDKASINRMVGRLGIAKGSIFQYFGSKKNLYFHIFEHAVALVKRSLKGVKAGSEGEDFFIRLAMSLQAGIYFIRRYPRIYQIYLKMLFQEDFPFRADLLKTIRLFSIDYLRPIIEEAVTAGQLREDLDPELAAFFLDAVLDRFLQAYCVAYMDSGLGLYQADEKVIEERIQDCIEMVRLGMATGDSPPGESAAKSMEHRA
ncbi:MAG: TetR/AcrR family transcriptional regulator [Deltaproteobacteria bacterium]|nr:TetR/AcrR family transcriptional regulator [Deltaproteobacteria bacterium]